VAVTVLGGGGIAGKLDKGSEGGEDVVWEVPVGGVSSMASSGCLL
jgi:hypothetical protein